MKKVLLSMLVICSLFSTAKAQNAKVDQSGNYTAIKRSADSSGAKTGKTFTDAKGNVYPVLISARGKLFYMRTSKTGNVYKAYLKLD